MYRSLAFSFLLIVLPSLAWAQGTPEDFERAASFDKRFRNLVQQETIDPQPIGNQGNFWFKTSDEKNVKSFLLVNPSKKKKRLSLIMIFCANHYLNSKPPLNQPRNLISNN